jgi:hypothetical protein
MITSPSVHPSKTKQSSLWTFAATGAPTVPPPLLLIIPRPSLSALLSFFAPSCILGLAPPDPSSKRIIWNLAQRRLLGQRFLRMYLPFKLEKASAKQNYSQWPRLISVWTLSRLAFESLIVVNQKELEQRWGSALNH